VGLPGVLDRGGEGATQGGLLLGAALVLGGSRVAVGRPAEVEQSDDLAGSVVPGT